MIYSKNLKRICKNSDLNDPDSVERYVFGLDVSNKYRNSLFDAYSHYCSTNDINWRRPVLKTEVYPVKIPTEVNIDKIIACATPKYATVFQISKHGLRPDEISKITLRDIDFDRCALNVRTSKMGLDRTLRLKPQTRDLLRDYVGLHGISDINQRLFASPRTIRDTWSFYRKRAYDKFRDPELLKIRLYDLRHWYGTTQYIKTRDILHVKYLMGHRNIESTMHYMHIAKGLINYSEEYTVKVSRTLEEYVNLLEQGFEYVSDYEGGVKILRKRK
jgi:integrase